ncbi:TPA: hypothetical protein HA241_04960 [Candidatus Woesearchaeota archaeon]|nr:hypothetical protein [Candidatus Woesearchaeota archaeon]
MTPKNVQRPVQGDLGAEVKYLSELIEDIESILKGKKTMESMIDALQQIVISLGRTEVRVDRDIQEEGIKLQRYLSQLPQKDPEYDKGKKIIEALGAERAVLGRALSRYTGTVAKDVRGSTQKMAWVKILENEGKLERGKSEREQVAIYLRGLKDKLQRLVQWVEGTIETVREAEEQTTRPRAA